MKHSEPDPEKKPAPDNRQASLQPPLRKAEPASTDVNQLSADEQMALFEEELKQNDWGHQPC